MKNVRISFDESLLKTIDNIAASSQRSRSAVVREALRYWIKHREIKAFENDWIKKLNERPNASSDTVGWMDSEHWGEI